MHSCWFIVHGNLLFLAHYRLNSRTPRSGIFRAVPLPVSFDFAPTLVCLWTGGSFCNAVEPRVHGRRLFLGKYS